MHGLQLRLILLLLTASSMQVSHIRLAEAQTDTTCGCRNIRVSYSWQAELAMSCNALADVAEYFQSIGLSFEPRVSLIFQQNVVDVSGSTPDGRPHVGRIIGCLRVR
jgi:hypothetical protein